MSNVIDFNTRDFHFDSEVENPAGTRKFVTDNAGNNVEVFELGDWKWAWDQIRCTKSLLPDTDYVFRFAMTGGFHDCDNVVSQFIIFFDNQWEDRYVYSLTKSEYKPVISKRYGDNLLRIYEIPFHTGSSRETAFMFRSQHTVACFMPAKDAEYYADMEDLDYEAWWKERQSLIGHARLRNEDASDDMEDWNSVEEEENSENVRNFDIDLSGATLSQIDLMRVLSAATAGNCRINLSGADITEFR